jgi:hypothetical protein
LRKRLQGEAGDVEFTTEEGDAEIEIVAGEEVESAEGAVAVADGSGDLFEVLGAVGGDLEGGEKIEVAPVGGAVQLVEDREAIDGSLDGGQLHGPAPVTLFHLAVVFEKGDVVGRGLDAQDNAVLVVHLDGGRSHVVTDAGALDAGMEVVPQLAEEVAVELAAEESGDLFGVDGEHRGADQSVVQRLEILTPLEDDVGRRALPRTWSRGTLRLTLRIVCGSPTSPTFPSWSGFLFLPVVLDAWSRRVIGWSMATHLRTELVLEGLNMALWRRRPENVIHHSDQGTQYVDRLRPAV